MASKLPQPADHSPAYNTDTARAAEQVGFDHALTQVRYLPLVRELEEELESGAA